MATDERIEKLYELPLDEFTAARNALAKSLKDEGDSAAADAVRSLSKPSIAAWVVNQLARRHADEMEELLAMRDRLGDASSASEMRSISTERHHLISELTDKAREVLEASGNAASAQTLSKVSGTLYGGGNDDERAALKNGTLTRELQASGFDAVGELDWSLPPEDEEAKGSDRKADKARRDRARLEAELDEAEDAAAMSEREARETARVAEVAANDAEAARKRVERLRARLEKL